MEKADGYTLMVVRNPWRGAADTTFSYALVPRTEPLPPRLPERAQIIRTPVQRLVSMATVYIGYLQALDAYDHIAGVAYLSHTFDPVIHQRVADARIARVPAENALDVESLLLLQPDMILTSSIGGSAFDSHPKLMRARLPVVMTAGYMERHPLARAEWIKFIGAFLEQSEQAERIFEQVSQRYEELQALAASATTLPTVFANAPYGGKWHLPGGDSYAAQFLAHAGARYLWQDDKTLGGIPLDLERVYYVAADADFWINPSAYRSLAELLSADERFAKFEAVQKGNVYNNTKRSNRGSGNDVWERGIVHPEEVLADLIHIFHPGLLPDHKLVYYEQLK